MTVKQASQVLDVLEYFALHQKPVTLSELADHFGWPRSSTFNLLTTLAERGYLFEPRPRAGYYPTFILADVVEKITAGQPALPESRALLEELSSASGETAVLAAQAGMNVVFLDAVESVHAVRYTAPRGKVVPLVASATGRALLAQRPAHERAALLRKAEFKAFTPHTLMSADAIETEIQQSLVRGWFVGRQEYSQGLSAVAFAVSVQGRSYAIMIAGPEQRLGPGLEHVARQARDIIERWLGHPISLSTNK